MKEREAREMIKELFERHNVSPIPAKFYPKRRTTKEDITTDSGVKFTKTTTMYGTFNMKITMDEILLWIEFYGSPLPRMIRHEFRHYLEDYLGKKYIRETPSQPKKGEGGR